MGKQAFDYHSCHAIRYFDVGGNRIQTQYIRASRRNPLVSQPVSFAFHGRVDSFQEASHGKDIPHRHQFDPVIMKDYFERVTRFDGKIFPDFAGNHHLEF